jgi:hypothetical protein
MPIEIKELVLKATVRVSKTAPEAEYITRDELDRFERKLRRDISREIAKEIKRSKYSR